MLLQTSLFLPQSFFLHSQFLQALAGLGLLPLCRRKVFLLGLCLLCQPVECFPAISLGQSPFRQHRCIISIICPTDGLEGSTFPLELLDCQPGLFHVFQGFCQRTQILIRKRGQGSIQDLVDDAGLEIARKLGTAQLDEQFHQFFIFADIFITKDILIYHGHVLPLLRGYTAILPNGIFQFPARQRNLLFLSGFRILCQMIQGKILTNAAAILQHKAPKIHLGIPPASMQTNACGDVLIAVFPLVFQIKITCSFIILADFLFAQQIIVHGAGFGTKTIQTICAFHTVQ